MQVDIFKSNKSSTRFLLLPKGQKPSSLVATHPELAEFGGDAYRKTIELPDPRGELIGLDTTEAVAGINKDGFYVSAVSIRTQEITKGPKDD